MENLEKQAFPEKRLKKRTSESNDRKSETFAEIDFSAGIFPDFYRKKSSFMGGKIEFFQDETFFLIYYVMIIIICKLRG
jgi:hypothetical protein